MSIEHRPGVICVVIGSMTEQGRRHIGKQVELVKTVMPEEEVSFPDGDRVTFAGKRQGWLVKGNIVSSMARVKGYAFFQQRHLMPIQDPDQPFKDVRKTVLHITVDKTLKVTEVDFVPEVVKV